MRILCWPLLMTLSLILTMGCTEEDAEIQPLASKLHQPPEPVLKDQQLEEIAHLLASFIDENQITAELFTYATEESDGEVYAPFKSLFDQNESDNGRLVGAFASKFRSSLNAVNGRKRGKIQLEDLEKMLGDGYALYAPYLLEKFSGAKQPITVSWYNGQNTSGVTPGILSVKSCLSVDGGCVQVTDDYASKNPTVVIVPVEPGNNIEQAEAGENKNTVRGGPSGPSNLSCSIKNVTLEMPKYRLRDHVRAWPRRNLLYFWVLDDGFINADGLAQNGYYTPLWLRKKVSRHNVGKWLNSELSFVIHNWTPDADHTEFVFGYHKLSTGEGLTYTNDRGVTIKQNNAVLMSTPFFTRCVTLSRQADAGNYGLKDGYRVYRFGKMEFYLKGDPF